MQLSHNTNQVLQDSTIHNPTLEPGTHEVSYYLPSNPSSPVTLPVLGDVIQQPALVCPVHCPASRLVCPPVCPLHYPLALYVMSSSQLVPLVVASCKEIFT